MVRTLDRNSTEKRNVDRPRRPVRKVGHRVQDRIAVPNPLLPLKAFGETPDDMRHSVLSSGSQIEVATASHISFNTSPRSIHHSSRAARLCRQKNRTPRPMPRMKRGHAKNRTGPNQSSTFTLYFILYRSRHLSRRPSGPSGHLPVNQPADARVHFQSQVTFAPKNWK